MAAQARKAHRADRGSPDPDPARRVSRDRLREHLRGRRTRGAGPRRDRRAERRRRRRAGPGALRVPDRRRVRLAALRLRTPARRRDGDGGAGGTRRGVVHARPRGPRHRPDAQTAGLPAAGRRRRHRGCQPQARIARRRKGLRHRRADPRRPRRPFDAAADEQPGQACRAGRLRVAHHRAGAPAGAGQRGKHPLPDDQTRQDGPRLGRAGRLLSRIRPPTRRIRRCCVCERWRRCAGGAGA